MALVLANRVRETSTTTGTGTLTLAGAVSGFRTFSSAIGNGNTCFYCAVNGTQWEVGVGTVAAGTLARTTLLSSSTGSAINFTSGTKDVFVTYASERALFVDAANTVGVNINGTVGATTPAVGKFTQAYSANLALSDGATVAWDASTGQVATFTFVSTNRTMGAPSNLLNGAFYALAVIQNGGANTLTWNSVFKWAGGAAPTLSTAAGAKDYFTFRSDGSNLYESGRVLGAA